MDPSVAGAMAPVFPEALVQLEAADPEVYAIIQDEKARQWCAIAGRHALFPGRGLSLHRLARPAGAAARRAGRQGGGACRLSWLATSRCPRRGDPHAAPPTHRLPPAARS